MHVRVGAPGGIALSPQYFPITRAVILLASMSYTIHVRHRAYRPTTLMIWAESYTRHGEHYLSRESLSK